VRTQIKLFTLPVLALALALSACAKKPTKPPPRIPEVGFVVTKAETVPLPPDMIYEIAEGEGVELRNDHVGFVDYVPMGSLAKGRAVAMGNKGAMRTCGSCHGNDYRGHGEAPRLAGRSAYYLIRQLADMRAGNRKGEALGKMKEVVGKLSDADILNVAAYMASRTP
jgi:cytochrome c553